MRRMMFTVAITVTWILVAATPASAHSVSGVAATNYQTRLMSVSPEVPGVEVRVVETGSRFELSNRTTEDLVVLGYESEPYLRVGPDGVFQNLRSPSTYINATRTGDTTVPDSADPDAPPEWERVSGDHIARWHDHRIHWMGNQDSPAVRRDPGKRHVIFPEWIVPMRLGDRDLTVTGDLVWVPGPSPVPWLLLSIVLLAGVAALALTGFWAPALAIVVAVLVAVDVAHAFGIGFTKAGTTGAKLAQVATGSYYALIAWAAGAVGAWRLFRGRSDGMLVAGLAGLLIAVFGGIADYADLSHSQIPFVWGATIARLLVAVSLGAGLGLVGAAAISLRRSPAQDHAVVEPMIGD